MEGNERYLDPVTAKRRIGDLKLLEPSANCLPVTQCDRLVARYLGMCLSVSRRAARRGTWRLISSRNSPATTISASASATELRYRYERLAPRDMP
jgi:hypothetical protein